MYAAFFVIQELPLNLADFMVLKDRRTAAKKGISQLRKGMRSY